MISLFLSSSGTCFEAGFSFRLNKNSRSYRFFAVLLSGFQNGNELVGCCCCCCCSLLILSVDLTSVGAAGFSTTGCFGGSSIFAGSGVTSTFGTVVVVDGVSGFLLVLSEAASVGLDSILLLLSGVEVVDVDETTTLVVVVVAGVVVTGCVGGCCGCCCGCCFGCCGCGGCGIGCACG